MHRPCTTKSAKEINRYMYELGTQQTHTFIHKNARTHGKWPTFVCVCSCLASTYRPLLFCWFGGSRTRTPHVRPHTPHESALFLLIYSIKMHAAGSREFRAANCIVGTVCAVCVISSEFHGDLEVLLRVCGGSVSMCVVSWYRVLLLDYINTRTNTHSTVHLNHTTTRNIQKLVSCV